MVAIQTFFEERMDTEKAEVEEELQEAEAKLSLVKFNFRDQKRIVVKAFKKLLHTCGNRSVSARSKSLSKKWIKEDLGVFNVVAKFREAFEDCNSLFMGRLKLLNIYNKGKKDHPGKILASSGATNIDYLAEIFKSYLLDGGYILDG